MISFPQAVFMAQAESYVDSTGRPVSNKTNPYQYKLFFSQLAQYLASIDPSIESINLNVSINMKDGTSYNGF